jgi:hypothetical protein
MSSHLYKPHSSFLILIIQLKKTYLFYIFTKQQLCYNWMNIFHKDKQLRTRTHVCWKLDFIQNSCLLYAICRCIALLDRYCCILTSLEFPKINFTILNMQGSMRFSTIVGVTPKWCHPVRPLLCMYAPHYPNSSKSSKQVWETFCGDYY